MKRLTSIFLALAMLLTLAPMNIFAAEAENTVFSDMKDTDYYAQAATVLAQLDILAGYPDGTFGAEKTITRAEMAAIVCRMTDKETDAEKANGKTIFDDVSSNHWASGYINIASKEGIINGDGNGQFRPEDDVKHEEAIKMVVCALGYGNDVEVDENDWSKGYLEVADEKGISDDLKGTKGKASTRGDIAVMTYNGLATDDENAKIPTTPVASVTDGEYKSTQKVKLTTTTKDAEIYYTTDGTTWDTSNRVAAIPVIAGSESKVLVSTHFNNGSFESNLNSWKSAGDVRVLNKLSELSPTNQDKMAIITTGIGSAENDYLQGNEGSILQQSFVVPNDATFISFDYNVISEEPTEYINKGYNDQFVAELIDEHGNVISQIAYESIDTSEWFKIDNINFDGGDETTYHTNWKTVSFNNLDAYQGKRVSLRFRIWDVGDSIYDTAALIDNIVVSAYIE